MGRTPCSNADGLRKGAWTAEEDQKLVAYIHKHGEGKWRFLPAKAGLKRCGKSCRLRWANYLRPGIKRGEFSAEEKQTIIKLHSALGSRWAEIARHLPKRTDNQIKNYWNAHLKKVLAKMGVDRATQMPTGGNFQETPQCDLGGSSSTSSSVSKLLNKLAKNLTTLQSSQNLQQSTSTSSVQVIGDMTSLAFRDESVNALFSESIEANVGDDDESTVSNVSTPSANRVPSKLEEVGLNVSSSASTGGANDFIDFFDDIDFSDLWDCECTGAGSPFSVDDFNFPEN